MTTRIFGINGEPDIIQNADFDFDCCHTILTTLMTVLQRRFKEEMNLGEMLLPPRANIVFAMDSIMAAQMIEYMTTQLVKLGGFGEDEFRFVCKSSDKDGMQRLRLEFHEGVNSCTIEKLAKLANQLEKAA